MGSLYGFFSMLMSTSSERGCAFLRSRVELEQESVNFLRTFLEKWWLKKKSPLKKLPLAKKSPLKNMGKPEKVP
jgi:hypothetical protein